MAIAPGARMRDDAGEHGKVLVDWLAPWLSGGGSLLFMTNYDGTLTPHVSDPGDAWLALEVQHHLGESLARRASTIQGMQVETKRLGVTVHYRHMTSEGRRSFETELSRAIHQSHGGRLKIFHGTKAIEILPQVGWSKGHCALRIREWALDSLPQPMLSVYIGDDWTDEMAFGALVGKAITVRVGPPEMASRATYRVDGVGAVHHLLERLAYAAGQRGAA